MGRRIAHSTTIALGEPDPDPTATETTAATPMIHPYIMGASIKVSNMHLAKIIQIMPSITLAPVQKERRLEEEAEEEDGENKTDV